jgi:hypothetical protein
MALHLTVRCVVVHKENTHQNYKCTDSGFPSNRTTYKIKIMLFFFYKEDEEFILFRKMKKTKITQANKTEFIEEGLLGSSNR